MAAFAGISAVIFVVVLWGIVIFNRLVTLRNDTESAWHQIDVQLKRRYDLIPNLVAAVKGYMEYERDVLTKVTEARARALAAVALREKAAAEDDLSRVLARFLAVIEGYPNLKSSENVMELQEELVSTENRIAFARQFYNDLVANFKTRIEGFPDVIISSVFSFRSPEFFSADPEDRALPRV
jgi:LemA protein